MITWKQCLKNRNFMVALVIISIFVTIAVAAPVLSPPEDPNNPSPLKIVGRFTDPVPHPPSGDAILGTMPGQFDIYHALIWGTRSALRFGFLVTLITASLGTLLGAVAGFAGGRFNRVVMRITDAFLAFPALAGYLLFQLLLTPIDFIAVSNEFVISTNPTQFQRFLTGLHLNPMVVTLIFFSWMGYSRIINANILQLKQAEFVEAARSIGVSNTRIIIQHLLPNAIAPNIVLAARDVGGMVILAATFTFVGVGSLSNWGWGDILVESRDWIIGVGGNPLSHWWVFLPATLTLIIFSVSWNLLGNGLNEILNPYQDYKVI